jgi:hypothetical protein
VHEGGRLRPPQRLLFVSRGAEGFSAPELRGDLHEGFLHGEPDPAKRGDLRVRSLRDRTQLQYRARDMSR